MQGNVLDTAKRVKFEDSGAHRVRQQGEVIRAGTGTRRRSPKVELRDVDLRYFGLEGETEALKDISLSVAAGEFVAIIGQSGCGKSTLLSLISGILEPTEGAVLVDGKLVAGPSRKVGYMLQQDYLFEWRTILENAVLGAEIQGADMGKARASARLRCSPATVSASSCTICRGSSRAGCASGWRSRARSAPSRTSCCSTSRSRRSNSQTRLALADEVTEILRREGKTAILVTHDIGEAISMAERVIVLSRRPGRVKSEHADPLRDRLAAPAPRRSRRATRPSSTAISTRSGRSSKSMSKVETATAAGTSPQYRQWLRRERRGRLTVRAAQLAILLVFLVLWEVLPQAHIINPLLTSYPSALWPTFLELLQDHAAAGEHPRPHLVHRARHRARIHRRDGARHGDRRGAVVVGPALQGARSVSGGGERHAEDRVRADLLHLARRHAVDLRHVAGDLAVHHHPDDLQRLPGHRSEQGQAGADLRRQPRARSSPRWCCPAACRP